MSAPTPAAVHTALNAEVTALADVNTLRDHIRAVAAEMRKESEEWYAASMKHGGNQAMTDHANDIEKFADRLEGRES